MSQTVAFSGRRFGMFSVFFTFVAVYVFHSGGNRCSRVQVVPSPAYPWSHLHSKTLWVHEKRHEAFSSQLSQLCDVTHCLSTHRCNTNKKYPFGGNLMVADFRSLREPHTVSCSSSCHRKHMLWIFKVRTLCCEFRSGFNLEGVIYNFKWLCVYWTQIDLVCMKCVCVCVFARTHVIRRPLVAETFRTNSNRWGSISASCSKLNDENQSIRSKVMSKNVFGVFFANL